jgi:N-acetylglucosamine-6-phosphate deacetylase
MSHDLHVLGGRVVTRRGVAHADVVVADGRIVAVGGAGAGAPVGAGGARPGGVTIDASDLLVAPGFIDTQINGAVGVDLTTEPERVQEVAAALPRYGVSAFLPTVISSTADVPARLLEALARHRPGECESRPLGAHLEGPMLNTRRRGAHPSARLRTPSSDLIEGWTRAAGVAMVTLAPELPNALDVTRSLTQGGVVVSAGHTDATTADVLAALDAGVSHLTHLFNAMRPLHHRDPGPIGVAMSHPTLTAGLIVDGVHLHPRTVAAAWAAMGRRLNLVTDAMASLGCPPGRMRIGGMAVTAGVGVVKEGGILAGSNLSLDQAVRNLAAWTRCSLPDAIATVTSTPADVLGLKRKGRVVEGADADLVLLDDNLQVVATVVAGAVAYDSR